MSVELEPAELGFRRPFTREVSQILRLSNPNKDPVAFKVKTTAPKQIDTVCDPTLAALSLEETARFKASLNGRLPNNFILTGHAVLLQAMKEDPPLDARCRDKFLVQSVLIDGSQEIDAASVWSNIDTLAKDSIKEKKIRVVFLAATGKDEEPNMVHDGTVSLPYHLLSIHPQAHFDSQPVPDDAPPAYSSPGSTLVSPHTLAPSTSREYDTPTKSPSPSGYVDSSPTANGANNNTSSTTGAISSAAASTLNTATSSISAAASGTSQTLQQKLDEANATIKSLKAQLEDQGLRQRKTDAVAQDARERVTTGTTGMGVQNQPAEGVPVQIVAALCLLSFLLAYFFF
ncbi:phosphatidylinositol-binding protein scs2 [Thelotrema lepadinum]|nr:phosphatidylinositol-binding protein scs2 [Thelotrema lepadinum]